jgi:hypothetical protein
MRCDALTATAWCMGISFDSGCSLVRTVVVFSIDIIL